MCPEFHQALPWALWNEARSIKILCLDRDPLENQSGVYLNSWKNVFTRNCPTILVFETSVIFMPTVSHYALNLSGLLYLVKAPVFLMVQCGRVVLTHGALRHPEEKIEGMDRRVGVNRMLMGGWIVGG